MVPGSPADLLCAFDVGGGLGAAHPLGCPLPTVLGSFPLTPKLDRGRLAPLFLAQTLGSLRRPQGLGPKETPAFNDLHLPGGKVSVCVCVTRKGLSMQCHRQAKTMS